MLCRIASADPEKIQAARDWINGIIQEPEVGKIYTGKVVGMPEFGAFVNFMGAKDGLVHISEIKNERVANVKEVLTEGQTVKVKVIGIDDRGKVKLSMRLVDQDTGEELPDTRPAREPREGGDRERSDRGPRRDGDRGPRRDGGRDGGRDRGPRRDGGNRERREREPEGGDAPLPAFLTGNDD